MRINFQVLVFFLSLCSLLSCVGCSGTSRRPQLSVEERIARDVEISKNLTVQLKGQIETQMRDRDVSEYLRQLGVSLIRSMPEIALYKIEIDLLKESKVGTSALGGIVLPAGHLYLSTDLLKTLRHENEVAALLAVLLVIIESGEIQERYQSESSKRAIEAGVFFKIDSTTLVSYVPRIVGVLYESGYDARGLPGMLERCLDSGVKCGYTEKELRRIMDASWKAFSEKTPLRNPVVTSDRFLRIIQRIRRQ